MNDQPARRVRDIVEAPPVQPAIRKRVEDDLAALLAFGAAVPNDDWLYLDIDLHTEATIMRLINAVQARNWRQFVAVIGDEIVGYASVRQLPGWKRHVGDIALVVRSDYRRRGIGTALAEAAIDAGGELSLRKLIVEIVEEHYGAQHVFVRLGFRCEGLLENYAIDYLDRPRNLMLLSYEPPPPHDAAGKGLPTLPGPAGVT
jgi:RimJ/RimL family protein N-acetyltransferase